MSPAKKFIIKNGVKLTMGFIAFFARRKSLAGIAVYLTGKLASATIKNKKIKKADTLEGLGKQWQRGFPSDKQVPITHFDEKTVYTEIHTTCPLRGTGDTTACYKMMHYDRKIVEKAGGQLIVLNSQAEPGVHQCKLAIRFANESVDDLTPAHLKTSEHQ